MINDCVKLHCQTGQLFVNNFRLLHAEVFGPIIKTSAFPEFSSWELLVSHFFISTMHSISFVNWYVSSGRKEI